MQEKPLNDLNKNIDQSVSESEFTESNLSWKESTKKYIEEHIDKILDDEFPREGYMSTVTDPESGESYSVVDIEELQRHFKEGISYKGVKVIKDLVVRQLFVRHKNDMVLTPEQVIGKDYSPKPLFYTPTSTEEATNIIDVADAEFQLPLWELHRGIALSDRGSLYPTENGEKLSSYEARAAIELFHPDFGDARRDPRDGRLYVKNGKGKERVVFSGDLLKILNLKERITGRQERRSLREGLRVELPNLIASGALRIDDIRELTLSNEKEIALDFTPKKISSSSYVMIHGVNHYVGSRFAGQEAELIDVNNAVVFDTKDGKKIVTCTFTVLDQENASDTYTHKNGSYVVRANADKTKPLSINYEKLVALDKEGLQKELRPEKIKDLQRLVTDRFVALNDLSARAEELVRSEFSADDEKIGELAQSVKKTLQNQALKVIEIAAAAPDEASLKESLASFTFDARAYVALLHSVGVEAMLSNPLYEISPKQLTQEQKNNMTSLLRENYLEQYPNVEDEEFRTVVESSLRKSFQNDKTHFHVLEDEGKIVSFNRFDEIDDGRSVLYFGSFNADPQYRGVGSVMLERTIQSEMSKCEVMFAHCDPRMAITQKYIEDGFVATQTETVAGKFSFEIWRSADVKDRLITKQMSVDELVVDANVSPSAESDYFVREVNENDPFHELDEDLPYLLTRYFTYNGKIYAAFELNSGVSRTLTLQTAPDMREKAKIAA